MSTALATQAPNRDLVDLLTSPKAKEQIVAALPKYYSQEKFVSIVRTAINKNPKLAGCTRESFMVAMITAAQSGMMPDGRTGHLIPRYNNRTKLMECQFQPDYKGKVQLIRRSERVADVYAECVRQNDTFRITMGLHRDLIHEPNFDDPGSIIGAYAVISYKDGTSSWCYVPRVEVEAIRERSESWKAHKKEGYSTPWITDEGEMFKKTAINRLAKLADLDVDTLDRLDADPELRIIHEDAPPALKDSAPKPKALLPTRGPKAKTEPAPAAAPETQPEPEATEAQAEVVEEPADDIPMEHPTDEPAPAGEAGEGAEENPFAS